MSASEEELITVPDPSDISAISQSHCSPADVLRMQNILQEKLELNHGNAYEPPITSLYFLR